MTLATFSTLDQDLNKGRLAVSWSFCDANTETKTIPVDQRPPAANPDAVSLGDVAGDV